MKPAIIIEIEGYESRREEINNTKTTQLGDLIKNSFEFYNISPKRFKLLTKNGQIDLDNIFAMLAYNFYIKYGNFLFIQLSVNQGMMMGNTKVKLVNCKEKNVSKLKIGDCLLSHDTQKNYWTRSKVTAIDRIFTNEVCQLNTSLLVNKSQLVFTSKDKWKEIKNLHKDDKIYTFSTSYTKVNKIPFSLDDYIPIYDISLSNQHNFFANEVLVHNQEGSSDGNKQTNILKSHDELWISSKGATTKYKKHFGIDYFDKMNPNKTYPLIINISNFKARHHKKMENLVTGERKTQVIKKKYFELKDSKVKVRPLFSGCITNPPYRIADFDKEDEKLIFSITPIVLGKVKGYIELLQEEEVISVFEIDSKVVNPKLARAIAFYGILGSFTPKLLEYLNIRLFQEDGITDIIVIIGVIFFLLLSIIYTRFIKPKKNDVEFTIKDLHEELSKETEEDKQENISDQIDELIKSYKTVYEKEKNGKID